MKFVTVRELRNSTAAIREQLEEDKDLVLTANGKPFAILSEVNQDSVEEQIQGARRARLRATIGRIQAKAKADGLDGMSMDEINAIIAEGRAERRTQQGEQP